VDLIGFQSRQNTSGSPLSPVVEEAISQLSDKLSKWYKKTGILQACKEPKTTSIQ